jgi:UDP-N-acetylglucosamine acyltransferase
MASIHPTAIIGSQVELAEDVVIGPYCLIDGPVIIGPGTVIHGHSHLAGSTTIGRGCAVGPAAYIGLPPQHTGYKGQPTHVVIGDDVIIRETATVHRAFHEGIEHATRIGSRCLLMTGAHVGHDSVMGEGAFLGGGSVVHQFVRVGRLAMVQGNAAVNKDLPPFAAMVHDSLKGYNAVGCRRAGMSHEAIAGIRAAFHCIHSHRTVSAAMEAIRRKVPDVPEVRELLEFYRTTRRGVTRSLRSAGGNEDNREL